MATSANLGGVVRETLSSSPTATVIVGGVVREVLISGTGLYGTAGARSGGRASASVLTAGVSLSGTAGATSRGRAYTVSLVTLAGRAGAKSRAGLVQLPAGLALAGRIGALSRAGLTERGIQVIQARARAASRARGTLTQRPRGPQNAVTLNV